MGGQTVTATLISLATGGTEESVGPGVNPPSPAFEHALAVCGGA